MSTIRPTIATLPWPPWIAAALLWTILCLLLGVTTYRSERLSILRLAEAEARTAYNKDLVYRRWAAGHGGVYVPVDTQTPPNPYLDKIPERDLTTPSGRRLTLVNPAYMTRQVHELAVRQYGTRGHITSLTPLRSENAPDPWERQSLEALLGGAEMMQSVVKFENGPHLRTMFPLRAEETCLKCHTSQHYRPGEVMGGISVTVSLAPYEEALRGTLRTGLASHGAIWGGGLLILLFFRRQVRRQFLLQEQLRRQVEFSENKYRLLAEYSTDWIACYGQDSRILFASETCRGLIGFEPEEVIGTIGLELVHPDDREKLVQAMQRLFVTGKDQAEEYRARCRDGSYKWVETRGRLLPGGWQGDAALIGITRDLTIRKLNEEQNLRAAQLASVGELAAGVAHEINNPITGIINYAQLMLNKTPVRLTYDELLTRIISEGDRVAAIVKSLLHLSRDNREGMSSCPLGELVDIVFSLVSRQLEQDDIDFTAMIPPTLPRLKANPQQLEQMLLNLVHNSRYALNEKSHNKDSAKILRVSAEEILGSDGRQLCQLTVYDSGTGIPPELLARVTTPFVTTKPAGVGTGLGLSLCQEIVCRHGGSLRIESEYGDFTRVIIEWPFDVS